MFKSVEWLIAWRYLRAKRADGGVSAIAIISLIGIALGVFAMIATFSVRQGFRSEYVQTILGNEGHGTVYPMVYDQSTGVNVLGIPYYTDMAEKIETVPGVEKAIPLVTGQVMGTYNEQNAFMEVLGIEPDDFREIKTITENPLSRGDAGEFGGDSIAIGAGVARSLGLVVGDTVTLTSANGVPSPFGSYPRQYAYRVAYNFDSGNDFVDRVRVYVPIEAAQSYFNLEGFASHIDYLVDDPDHIDNYTSPVLAVIGENATVRTWKQKNAGVLNGLQTEDRMMFILTAILVLVATFTIVAGLIMLVKNKTSDIAILRTMGFTRGSVTRIFFLAGVTLGLIGTILGVILGVLFAVYFQPIFTAINWMIGGGALDTWALQVIPNLHAELTWGIVLNAVLLSMGLSIVITYFPARNAAKLDPAEALRHG